MTDIFFWQWTGTVKFPTFVSVPDLGVEGPIFLRVLISANDHKDSTDGFHHGLHRLLTLIKIGLNFNNLFLMAFLQLLEMFSIPFDDPPVIFLFKVKFLSRYLRKCF